MSQKKKLSPLLRWEALEYHSKARNLRHNLALFGIFFLLIAYGLFTNNLLMSILFILLGAVFYMYENKPPKKINIAILEDGIFIKDQVYPFDSIESFWIDYEPGEKKELSLQTKTVFLPHIKVPLENQNPLKVRKILLNFIPEKKHASLFQDLLEKLF